ncbi:hypothetical protein Aspvir_009334 [Aspergillus viridinutans]|uniref:Uncharacterized protein n=1 Tax=Aspergillus viridinutans TaxID=75553 RepID=A0A9P3F8C0_ASPVI|nr:uncharacterized protein Aspvir_009334 [Aspergillus viridinutans]GIK05230.1 hypothetical protein Aspvir_009334 [Aspergillus viridinutans]
MNVSLPLALHLRSPITFDWDTKQRLKPGTRFKEGFSLNEFFFINERSARDESTVLFANILRPIFDHQDWSQLYVFFTKRYSEEEGSLDAEIRTVNSPDKGSTLKEPAIICIKTDPSSVGLPKDFISLLRTANITCRSGMVGADTQPCAIGPAISFACGPGTYMDLTYAGQRPGEYSKYRYVDSKLKGTVNSEYQVVAEPIETTKKGGRGRYWAEWARLWTTIAEWVWEYESEVRALDDWPEHSFKWDLSAEEKRSFDICGKVPREYLDTDAINAADAIRDVFVQLAHEPRRFQGIEWDFLDIAVLQEVQDAFHARFGMKNPNPAVNRGDLLRQVARSGSVAYDGYSQAYDEVSPMAIKHCPESFLGKSWETWLLAIQGGDVVVVKTIFQALWAVLLLSHIPVHIKIIKPGEKFPKYRDSETVYI